MRIATICAAVLGPLPLLAGSLDRFAPGVMARFIETHGGAESPALAIARHTPWLPSVEARL